MPNTYPVFNLSRTISDEQFSFFKKNGFIHFKDFISKEEVANIIKSAEEVQEQLLLNGVQKINGVPLKFGQDLDGKPIIQRFAFMNQQSDVLNDLLKDSRFQTLRHFIGDDARIGSEEKDGMVLNHYINGPESKFTKMGWHTDGLRDIFLGGKLNPMLNIGIHLSTQKIENGGLRLIPGSHNQSLFKMLFRKKYFIDHEPDRDEVAVLPEAGDLTVHDGRLWHRVEKSSIVGETSRRRVIYVPIIAGEYAPKNEFSPTPFYQRFAGIVK